MKCCSSSHHTQSCVITDNNNNNQKKDEQEKGGLDRLHRRESLGQLIHNLSSRHHRRLVNSKLRMWSKTLPYYVDVIV